ncbi:hypothetical protein HKK55_08065 [Pseudomonas sp. ADAK18]|uniref:hypothetical protein n=1 Tax=Pseudomonas sp. ADAK18 TaxID=2730848 RepID=UPI0014637C7A|nr:hypothetical protein [Pseudomonas sp. ADAK18]QJI28674.1 hypothetical protein HKK55_08065 [Pseudomonas sp. ADAK18]
MSGSNWVAAASVIFTSLTAGYATYENNNTNKELEKLKQENSLTVEKFKLDQLLEMEKIKSTQEREAFLQDKTFEVRAQYCNDAKVLHKQLGDLIITSNDRNLEVKAAALTLKSKVTMQAFAYIDDGIYKNYTNQTKNSSEPDDNALVAALATQVRRCATMKPSS